jgi:hypothetical protein
MIRAVLRPVVNLDGGEEWHPPGMGCGRAIFKQMKFSSALPRVLNQLARLALIGTLLWAPWPLASQRGDWQPIVYGGVLVSLALWWMSLITRSANDPEGHALLVRGMIPPLLFVLIGAVQLMPVDSRDEIPRHAVLAEQIAQFEPPSPTPQFASAISIYPAATRAEAARLLLAACAMFLSVQFFTDGRSRGWLYAAIAINAAAIGVFGIWQRLNWNGKILGTFTLLYGGQPFGPFINRNSAANYLNIGVAAAAGWAAVLTAPALAQSLRGAKNLMTRDDRLRAAELLRTGGKSRRLPAAGWPLLTLCCAVAGVIGSFSRAGILSLGIMGVAAGWLMLKSQRARYFLIAAAIALPVASFAIVHYGLVEQLQERLGTLNREGLKQDLRLPHWIDTSKAILDRPLLGGGLGAYKYINRPYQAHANDLPFANADNTLFEYLIETGLVGFGLVVTFLVLAALAVSRLLRIKGPREQRDAAIVGGMALASQIPESLTNWGTILPANMLTLAALAGVVMGTAARAAAFDLRVSLTGRILNRGAASVLGLIMLVSAGAAWGEIAVMGKAFAAHYYLPGFELPESLSPSDVTIAIARATEAAAMRPDDAELQRALAGLWLFRFRTDALDAIQKEVGEVDFNPRRAWPITQPETIALRMSQLDRMGERDAGLKQIKKYDPDDCRAEAARCYRASRAGCRWMRSVCERIAALEMAEEPGNPAARGLLLQEALSVPSDSDALLLVGALARGLNARDPFAAMCFRRALEADPRALEALFQVVDVLNEPADWLHEVLPESVDLRLSAAERLSGTPLAMWLVEDVESRLAAGFPIEGSRQGELGRVAFLKGDFSKALRLFQEAGQERPDEWQWRIYAAAILRQQGKSADAETEVQVAGAIANNVHAARVKLQDIEKWARGVARR